MCRSLCATARTPPISTMSLPPGMRRNIREYEKLVRRLEVSAGRMVLADLHRLGRLLVRRLRKPCGEQLLRRLTDPIYSQGWCFDFATGKLIFVTEMLQRMGLDPDADAACGIPRWAMQTFDRQHGAAANTTIPCAESGMLCRACAPNTLRRQRAGKPVPVAAGKRK